MPTHVVDSTRALVLRLGCLTPSHIIEAAREQLLARRSQPKERLAYRHRARLQTRLERLREQHEWGDITNEAYRQKRDEVRRELAGLPNEHKLIAFDRNRRVMTSLSENIDAATPGQLTELIGLLVDMRRAPNRSTLGGGGSGSDSAQNGSPAPRRSGADGSDGR